MIGIAASWECDMVSRPAAHRAAATRQQQTALERSILVAVGPHLAIVALLVVHGS